MPPPKTRPNLLGAGRPVWIGGRRMRAVRHLSETHESGCSPSRIARPLASTCMNDPRLTVLSLWNVIAITPARRRGSRGPVLDEHLEGR